MIFYGHTSVVNISVLTLPMSLYILFANVRFVSNVFQKSQVYYNIFGQEAGQPVRLPSVSCLSYNKRDNWLTRQVLGVRVR